MKPTSTHRGKFWTLLALAAIVAGVVILLRPAVSFEEIASREEQLRSAIQAHPVPSFLIGLAVFFGVSLIPGTRGKALIVGWLFGPWFGLLLVNLGLTLAALVAFAASRVLLRDGLQSRFGAYLARVNKTLEREGGLYLFAIRVLAVLPFTFVNYTMGATAIRTRTFWWATQLGLLPGNLLFVYVGSGLPTLDQFATQGLKALTAPEIWLAFAGLAVLPFGLRLAVSRWRGRTEWVQP